MLREFTYANMGNYPLAKTEFEKVLKLNRKDGLALFHLGNVEVLLHNRQRGLELFKQAIECGYEDAKVNYSLGLFYEDDEKYDLTLLNYLKTIKTDENRPDVRVKKARLLLSNHEGYTSRSIRGNLSTDEWCGRCT